MRRMDLDGFNAKFRADADPWSTFVDADEATKRRAILRALGPARRGRIWEPASGAGANREKDLFAPCSQEKQP